MSAITEPLKFSTPFAETGLKNTIPATANNATGKAGFDKGFPERTMLPKASGGIPPSGMDFNGILFDVTAAIRYMQAGGKPTYDAAFAAAIGGYPSGAVLIGDDGVSVFQNAVAGNETDPNSGGAGWTRPDLQVMELYRRSYAEAGYNLVDGSFEAGGTLVNANDVLLQERTGKAFSGPLGAIPPGTDPLPPVFTDQSENIVVSAGSYASIRSYTGTATKIQCYGRENVFDKAQGVFVFDPSDTTSADDDGIILVDALGRRWKRQILGEIHPEWFGAVGNGIADDTVPMKKAVAKALSIGLPVRCLGGVYLLTSVIDMREPFDFNGGNSRFIINHAGDGFLVKEVPSVSDRRNVSSFRDMNFGISTTTPDSYIRVGVASLPEPTNIELNGLQFRATHATTAHIINERSYGLKVNNSAFNFVTGTCILLKRGIGNAENVYTYQCYINQVDITGCTYGVVLEGGKVQIRDSVIESCTQRAVWSKGIGFNPSVYMENVYFENNAYSIYFESQQPQGYTLNSEVKNCYFAPNSGQNYASSFNRIRLVNNKGFSFNKVEGRGYFSLADSTSSIPYNPTLCPTTHIELESPFNTNLDVLTSGTRKAVPFFNLKRESGILLNTGLRVTIVRNTSNNPTYWQGILQANDVNGMTWRLITLTSNDGSGGILAAPTFEKNPSDHLDMNLYFYYGQTAVTIITVEGMGGFG